MKVTVSELRKMIQEAIESLEEDDVASCIKTCREKDKGRKMATYDPEVNEMKLGIGSNPTGGAVATLSPADKEMLSFERDWEDDELEALELAADREMEPDMMLMPDRRSARRS